MNDPTFDYKGKKLFIYIQKLEITKEIRFLLLDVTDINNEIVDFSEKELAKVEILDYIKNDLKKDLQKCIVAFKIISFSKLRESKSDIRLEDIKKELLKEYDNGK